MAELIEPTCPNYKPILGDRITDKDSHAIKDNTIGTLHKCAKATNRLTKSNNCTECTNRTHYT